jgi:predicted 3-demethylubiquinone-9 3-methyltransferase (glyoxalase superfamily)
MTDNINKLFEIKNLIEQANVIATSFRITDSPFTHQNSGPSNIKFNLRTSNAINEESYINEVQNLLATLTYKLNQL